MFLILSPKNEGFVKPDAWTSNLDEASSFTKEEALAFVRADILNDQEAEVFPRFVGCRVVELRKMALARLRKIGFRVDDNFSLDVGKTDLEEARAKWPRQVLGFSTKLVRDGVTLSWESPRPWSAPGPNPKRLPKK